MTRLPVTKTYKLFIGGKFPRSESGRSIKVEAEDGTVQAHVCRASRKDLRDAVEAAGKARDTWASAAALLRGQILYRMAEMLEGKRAEFAEQVDVREVDASIDRLIGFAGWADKYAQVLGCNNPVGGPYYNFTIPEPTGVVGIVCPDDPPLLGLVSLLAPVLCAANTCILIGPETNHVVASMFGEVCATSDVPGGVVNILTGHRSELVEHLASHRAVGAIHGANVDPELGRTLQAGAAENLKRVHLRTLEGESWYDSDECESPWWIEPFVDMKTIWHPSGA